MTKHERWLQRRVTKNPGCPKFHSFTGPGKRLAPEQLSQWYDYVRFERDRKLNVVLLVLKFRFILRKKIRQRLLKSVAIVREQIEKSLANNIETRCKVCGKVLVAPLQSPIFADVATYFAGPCNSSICEVLADDTLFADDGSLIL